MYDAPDLRSPCQSNMEQSHGRFLTVGVVISGIAWTTWLALSSEAPGVVQ